MAMRNLMEVGPDELKRFLDSFDTILTDCDGVLWLGTSPIDRALEALNKLESMGKHIAFVSNNGTLTLETYCGKFKKMGYTARPEQIAIPSYVIGWYLKKQNFKGQAYTVGTRTFVRVLKEQGIDVVESAVDFLAETYDGISEELQRHPDIRAVIIDLDVNISWLKISKIIEYLKHEDVMFVAGALDQKIPFGKNKTIFGPGPIVDMITKVTNREPIVCAKPSEVMKNYVIEKFEINNPSRCLFIGDSFVNDMKFADYCGFNRLWVASGIDTLQTITSEYGNDSSMPDYYLPSLGHLLNLLSS